MTAALYNMTGDVYSMNIKSAKGICYLHDLPTVSYSHYHPLVLDSIVLPD